MLVSSTASFTFSSLFQCSDIYSHYSTSRPFHIIIIIIIIIFLHLTLLLFRLLCFLLRFIPLLLVLIFSVPSFLQLMLSVFYLFRHRRPSHCFSVSFSIYPSPLSAAPSSHHPPRFIPFFSVHRAAVSPSLNEKFTAK